MYKLHIQKTTRQSIYLRFATIEEVCYGCQRYLKCDVLAPRAMQMKITNELCQDFDSSYSKNVTKCWLEKIG